MKNIPAMSSAELRAARTGLGVTAAWLALHLQTTERTVLRWESGEVPVPADVADVMAELVAEAEAKALTVVQQIQADPEVTYLKVFRTEDQMPEYVREWGYPATWHQRIMAQAAARAGRPIRLFYLDEAPDGEY